MKREVFWKNPGYKGYPRLEKDVECDYLIVGGGVTGVSLAYFLAREGKKRIVLIEKNGIASGATGMAAGSIVINGELDIKQLIWRFGKKKAMRYWKENYNGLKLMREVVKREKINCDYDLEDTFYGALLDTPNRDKIYFIDEYSLEKDYDRMIELVAGKEIKKYLYTPMFKYAVLAPDSGISVNPLKFTQNLSKVAARRGVKIYEDTPLIKISKHFALTPKGRIKFGKVIMAIDSSIRDKRIRKIASTIAVTRRISERELRASRLIPKKIVWDIKDIYFYMKLTKDNRILFGYGDKHARKKHTKIDPHQPHIARINKLLSRLLPKIDASIEYAWTGSFGATKTRIPLIEHKGNKIVVGGAASQLVCMMAAKHIADRLADRKSSLSEFFGM